MCRASRFLSTAIVFAAMAASAWAGCYPPCFVPAAPVVPVCPPPVVPQAICCEQMPLLPPAPPLVSPIIVPYMPAPCGPPVPACCPAPPMCWNPPPVTKVRSKRGGRMVR